ncbi:DUF697 domain-containing protein [Deltaproteobacteria bacterium TL4]
MEIECLSVNHIAALVEGSVSDKERSQMIFHLNRCEDCYRTLTETLVIQKESQNLFKTLETPEQALSEVGTQASETPTTETSSAEDRAYHPNREWILKELNSAASRDKEGQSLIKNHVIWSMGLGVLPFPLIDMLGASMLQLKMLKKFAKLYQVPFQKHQVKAVLGSVAGGLAVGGLSYSGMSLMKMIPGMGSVSGAALMPLSAGASTYAMGKVFLQHFALGGTFLSLDPEVAREYFVKFYNEGRKMITSQEIYKMDLALS